MSGPIYCPQCEAEIAPVPDELKDRAQILEERDLARAALQRAQDRVCELLSELAAYQDREGL